MPFHRRLSILALLAAIALVSVPVFAASFTDVPVNLSAPGALFPTNRQDEPTIAVNPTNPSLLIAGANSEAQTPSCANGYCGHYWNIGLSAVYTSSDGGATWTDRGVLDNSPGWVGTPLYSIGDPVLAYGPRPSGHGTFSYANGARAYYSTLAVYQYGLSPYPSTPFKSVVAVSYSDDDGATWSAPVIAESRDNAVNFNDKNWITVDANPVSPYFGRVYVSWSDFRAKSNIQAEPIMVSASTDGGISFGTAKQVATAANPAGGGNGRQDSVSRTGPDGSVYVAWADAAKVLVAISRDGGRRWSRPVTVVAFDPIDDPIAGTNFRTGDPDLLLRLGMNIGIDPRAGSSTLYVTWANKTPSGGQIRVSTSTDKGLTWGNPVAVSTSAEGYAFFPAIDVAPNGRVDIGYEAVRVVDPTTVGAGNAAIDSWYVGKPAAGAWSAPLKVTSVSSDPAVSAQTTFARQFWGDYTTIVSSESTAWFVYTDGRNGSTCAAVDAYQRGVGPAPYPPNDCPGAFGNTDIYVSVIQP